MGCKNAQGQVTPDTAHVADIVQQFPSPYEPSQLLYFCKSDGSTGKVADRRILKYFPAGYTIDSEYYLKNFTPIPPLASGFESCAGATMDAGGREMHRVLGVPEYTAQLIYLNGKPDGNGWVGGYNTILLKAHPEMATALNAFLLVHPAHGCNHWPCVAPPPDPHAAALAALKTSVAAAMVSTDAVAPCKAFLLAMGA